MVGAEHSCSQSPLGPWEAPAAAEWLSVYRAVRRSHAQPELLDALVFYLLQPTKERPVPKSVLSWDLGI